jgi:NAD(P) transhydrogenase subunit alpha
MDMSILLFVKEPDKLEKRCALLPDNVKVYKRLGVTIKVESQIGQALGFSDQHYIDAGAQVFNDRNEALATADAVLSVRALPLGDLERTPQACCSISFFDPFNNPRKIASLLKSKRTAISMELIPRSTRCQKMDALSSQASLAGYAMVLKAMANLHKILPMMMTPAGTLKPAKVFIIGAGVAGLQAIATAKRMGANVIAYDTRPEVAQQVQSLGAKFLNIDLGATESTDQGYAKALSAQQLELQQQAQADCIASSDIVITTAQLFGRKPPLLISNDVIAAMKPGSVIVDMAAQDGGNVEASVAGETITYRGVKVIGDGDWAGEVALDASQMYANNLQALVQYMWNSETALFTVNAQDDVLQSALVTHNGEIINPILKSQYSTETV